MPEFRFRVTEVRTYTVRVEAWQADRAREDAQYYALWHHRDAAIGKSVEVEGSPKLTVEVVPADTTGDPNWVPPGPLPQFIQDLDEELTLPERGRRSPSGYPFSMPDPLAPFQLRWRQCRNCGRFCVQQTFGSRSWVHVDGRANCLPPLTSKAEPIEDGDDPYDLFDLR